LSLGNPKYCYLSFCRTKKKTFLRVSFFAFPASETLAMTIFLSTAITKFLPFILVCCYLPALVKGKRGDPYFYGDDFTYLELQIDGTSDRWLAGITIITQVIPEYCPLFDIRGDGSRDNEPDFRWKFTSTVADGPDPKAGECVKYGDLVYIQHPDTGRFMQRGSSNFYSAAFLRTDGAEKMLLRSNPGNGVFDSEQTDPAFGLCIGELDVIYIQYTEESNRWLKGRPLPTPPFLRVGVFANFNVDSEKQNYRWILRRDTTFAAAISCPVRNVLQGYWKNERFVGNEEELTITYESTRQQEISTTETTEWGVSVEATVQQSWNFLGQEGGVSLTVGGNYARSTAKMARDIVIQTEKREVTQTFQRGVIWQFVLELQDLCKSGWEFPFNTLVQTDNTAEPPCCLPGEFLDNNNYYGPCIDPDRCLCSDEVCQRSGGSTPPPPSPTPEPLPGSPTPTPSAGGDGGGSPSCFSGNTLMEVEDKGDIRMDQLQIGQKVLTKDGIYAEVYSFSHRNADARTTFLKISFHGSSRSSSPLEVTGEHLLYTMKKEGNDVRLVTASALKPGDTLLDVEGNPVAIRSIQPVLGRGLYAPLTKDGDIIVNGVAASSYIAMPKAFQERFSFDTQAAIQHFGLGMHRGYCIWMGGGCHNEAYDSEGYPFAVTMWFPILKVLGWLLDNIMTLAVAGFGLVAWSKMNVVSSKLEEKQVAAGKESS
jgi:hypothetical protein